MGICKLTELLKEKAPKSIRNTQIEKYRGWKVAIDASMILYQSLVAIRYGMDNLKNKNGETTAHIYGIFYKTINLLEKGIIPVYIFDGQPPELKENTLTERRIRKEQAEKDLVEAVTEEEKVKHAKRTVRATKYHVESAQHLLKVMGIPYMTAPNEAEGFCAALNICGAVNGVVSEDMDSLAFGGKILLRNFFPALMKKKLSVMEISLEMVLKQTGLDQSEFIDMCILLGCDYCQKLKGMGPKKVYDLVQEHRSIEKLLENGRVTMPEEGWPYIQAREIFTSQDAGKPPVFSLSPPDVKEILQFLVEENGFDTKKVETAIERLQAQNKTKKQSSLLMFAKKVV
ncbi:flap endonuclease-1 [Nematocida parisii]|uniref:flap endonuclease 1-B n=1 Tax=Nematocida parisii (strain ERTm1 / ATCC PRA-289) TaxID=881290 RepID=UPI000264B5EF|nr:flap endonuclease 1-B [Nematocida parisii ERTm1]EIJ92872.1 flap endonuclease 1-B [Nematocida parisii ERTm1]KAI5143964.1 flap endonuclease-1 [Nematocida parisii]KAI5154042.1 flap endonuclease-1 [Nematocida parisii]KAI5156849.1 flap endonuclease-1 [Nematocida parisii]|eukprot:XP_013060098.1 flap endonuclease 1-B [Nematocida parisii ERTm1]